MALRDNEDEYDYRKRLREERDKLNAEKKELKNLMNAYPKIALQGRELNLDAEWKKAFVAFVATNLINLEVSRKTSTLVSQISDKYDEAMKNGLALEMSPSNKKELEITFMIKNYLKVTAELLLASLPKLNSIMIAEQGNMDKDLYLYYVGTRANLQGTLDEQRRVAADIDTSIALCFKEAIAEGVNMELIEKETLSRMSTKQDIENLQKNIYNSTGLQMV
jgi:hypothetical protein